MKNEREKKRPMSGSVRVMDEHDYPSCHSAHFDVFP
jgi:hypothetical protein